MASTNDLTSSQKFLKLFSKMVPQTPPDFSYE